MSMNEEVMITVVAGLVNVPPADVRGFLVIVHVHDETEVCTQRMTVVTNVRPGMARTFALAYAGQLEGTD